MAVLPLSLPLAVLIPLTLGMGASSILIVASNRLTKAKWDGEVAIDTNELSDKRLVRAIDQNDIPFLEAHLNSYAALNEINTQMSTEKTCCCWYVKPI